jgi:hypothetical protein
MFHSANVEGSTSTRTIMIFVTALSLSDALRIPPAGAPIDPTNFASYVLPPVLSYFTVAVLAVTPKTHSLRVALWPLVALLALRAAISLDLSLDVPQRQHLNIELVVSEYFAFQVLLQRRVAQHHLYRSSVLNVHYHYTYPRMDTTKRTSQTTHSFRWSNSVHDNGRS